MFGTRRISRRDFLRMSAASLGGVFLAPPIFPCQLFTQGFTQGTAPRLQKVVNYPEEGTIAYAITYTMPGRESLGAPIYLKLISPNGVTEIPTNQENSGISSHMIPTPDRSAIVVYGREFNGENHSLALKRFDVDGTSKDFGKVPDDYVLRDLSVLDNKTVLAAARRRLEDNSLGNSSIVKVNLDEGSVTKLSPDLNPPQP